jgi:hypothetical protein
MEQITDKEKMALLGYDDPSHSLAWYKKHFDNMPEILEKYIIDTMSEHNFFPKEAKDLESRIRCQMYYQIIELKDDEYVVKINNTDRGEVDSEHVFSDIKDAAQFLIEKSFTMGGAIKKYWRISQ